MRGQRPAAQPPARRCLLACPIVPLIISLCRRLPACLPGAVPEEAKAHAVTAALGYVRAPVLSQRSSLPHLTAVRALKGDARYAKLHELLTIFASGDLEAYLAFHAANGAWVASQGVDHEASTETMRLLTLCTLAAGKPTLPFAAVAAALKVEASEVEGWVVRGITRGLLDARIDQVSTPTGGQVARG